MRLGYFSHAYSSVPAVRRQVALTPIRVPPTLTLLLAGIGPAYAAKGGKEPSTGCNQNETSMACGADSNAVMYAWIPAVSSLAKPRSWNATATGANARAQGAASVGKSKALSH